MHTRAVDKDDAERRRAMAKQEHAWRTERACTPRRKEETYMKQEKAIPKPMPSHCKHTCCTRRTMRCVLPRMPNKIRGKCVPNANMHKPYILPDMDEPCTMPQGMIHEHDYN